jgi:hypothetical protein
MLTIKCDFCGTVFNHASKDVYAMRITDRSIRGDCYDYDICDACLHKMKTRAKLIKAYGDSGVLASMEAEGYTAEELLKNIKEDEDDE